MGDRFLTRAQVAEKLNISDAQVYALIRRGELRHIKIDDRGVQRIDRAELEAYIERAYADAARWIAEHPYQDPE
jgi:excisionase family DNA binding protein